MAEESKGPAQEVAVASSSSRHIQLHPLVLLTISDHFTRSRGRGEELTIGAVVGFQDGRKVDVTDAFDLVHVDGEDGRKPSAEFLKSQFDLFATVYPGLQMLGWYTIGAEVTPEHLRIHRYFMELTENPLFLLMAPTVSADSKELPVAVHEAEVHVARDATRTLFVRVQFDVVTGEAERVSVDHVAKLAPTGAEGEPGLNPHLQGLHGAVHLLSQRLLVLRNYVQAVRDGSAPHDHSLLRRIQCVCNNLPTQDGASFHTELAADLNDSMLVTLLSTLTKQAELSQQVVQRAGDSFAVQRRDGRGGTVPGMFGTGKSHRFAVGGRRRMPAARGMDM